MKTIRNYVILAVMAALLSACASMDFFSAPKPLGQRIDDARLVVAAYAAELKDDVSANPPLIAADEAQAQLNALKTARDKINEADVLLSAGDPTTAEGRLRLANTILMSVRSRLAKPKEKK